MRLLLVIMTGIGFTLGLLCGLLLHLPADGMPANPHPHLAAHLHNNNDNDKNPRERRSVGDHSVVVSQTDDLAPKDHSHLSPSGQGNVIRGGSNSDPRSPHPKSSFQSPSQAGTDSNPFVSSGGRDGHNGNPQVSSGHRGSQAEQIGVTVKAGREEEKDTPRSTSSSPGFIQPVTSFTLRLRNTGTKFVVDSAVQRRVAGDARREEQHVEDSNNNSGSNSVGGGGDTSDHVTDTTTDVAHAPRPVNTNTNTSSLREVVDGVIWVPALEAACPRGVQQHREGVEAWRRKAAGMEVVRMEEGCGRMQNRLLTFRDGSRACARYRLNTDQIQGELYSYYLARLLHVPNLPPSLLLPVSSLSPQWRAVHLAMSQAQWADGRPVVLTQWMDGLLPAHIPHELRQDDRKVHPTWSILGGKGLPELCELLQWSDLIVLDYLTANLDRMVNNMFNRQWNAQMMDNAAHNLERTPEGSLVFLDNESGLFHGYRLLEKYQGYHQALLSSLCVFRASTAQAVKRLHRAPQSVGQELRRVVEEGEEHHRHLPPMPEKNVKVLQDRLGQVYEQIVRCEGLYGGPR
ncbi:four-jointed box protein 1-like [Babylonia areolata]|uniref:four-jointed box protein 1-like n=1 Tax=Babylonia areolata TaxID=304850 RepID=UPI003FCF5518